MTLTDKIQAATRGSRELDAEIANNINAVPDEYCTYLGAGVFGDKMPGRRRGKWLAPHYSASVDAALTLVPEGWKWEQMVNRFPIRVELMRVAVDNVLYSEMVKTGSHETLPLAICIAALKARGIE